MPRFNRTVRVSGLFLFLLAALRFCVLRHLVIPLGLGKVVLGLPVLLILVELADLLVVLLPPIILRKDILSAANHGVNVWRKNI